jgi:hypothetical protein
MRGIMAFWTPWPTTSPAPCRRSHLRTNLDAAYSVRGVE